MNIFRHMMPKPKSLKMEIHRRLAGIEDPRPHNHEGNVRASDLMSTKYEFCPREHAFMDLGLAKKKGEFVGTAQRMTFDHGSYMERQIRDAYLVDIVVGMWKCDVCGHPHPTFGKRPIVHCPQCSFKRWVYEEPRFSLPHYGVSGGIDFMLDWGTTKLRPIELKTLSPDDFKTLAAPLAEHKVRTTLYLKLIAESDWAPARRVDTSEATVLYTMKAYGIKDTSLKEAGIKDAPFSPFKEYVIKRDDALVKDRLDRARTLKAWRNDPAVGLPCGICANAFSKRAQSCPAVGACFSGKHPHVISWMEQGKPRHPGKKLL